MHARLAWMVLVASFVVALSEVASAQDLLDERSGYLAPKLVLGFGGEGELEADNLGGFDVGGEGDLELTYGFGGAYMHPLHEYFSLGGQLIIASWQGEAGENADFDRNSYLDLSVVPQGKVAVTERVELYASLPLGISWDFIGEDDFFGVEADTGFGFNFAVMFGARVAVDDGWGLLGELGYAFHSFTHGTEVPITGAEGPDLDIALGQLALNLGAWFSI